MQRGKMDKKAISPVVTTIMLILLALVLAAIILLWARGFMKEQVAKFDEPIENSCKNVNIQASVSGDSVLVNNLGDVPIFRLGLRVSGGGSSEINYQDVNLGQGASTTLSSSNLAGKTVELIPVLLGTSKKTGETKEFNCLSNPIIVQ